MAKALPLVLLALFLYVLLVRGPRKRAQETAALQSKLSPGDEVMLTSGIFGRLVAVLDDTYTVEISPDVVVRVHRGAIGSIVRDVDSDVDSDEKGAHGDGIEEVEAPSTGGATAATADVEPRVTDGDLRRGDVA